MEAFGIIGMSTGSTALAFAVIAWPMNAVLEKRITELENRLVEKGIMDKASAEMETP